MKYVSSKHILKIKFFGVIFFFTTYFSSFSQVIDVDPTGDLASNMTLEQLVENELINSPCADINNPSSFSGLTNGTSKSYGIFNYTGSDLPISRGIILSTGLVNNTSSSGPNAVDNSTSPFSGPGWDGDNDIKRILDRRLGNNQPTNDATYVQFNFIPNANQISFNYIFASEEWQTGFTGNNECPSSFFQDGFAFLIEGPGITPDPEFVGQTNEWKNIATFVDDNGITQPVSVGTIYSNSNCSPREQNANLYESYAFAGSFEGNNSPIEYNARTILLTAQTNVIIGETYTIKLVIADRTDQQLDSAVFIEAGSFTGIGSSLPDFDIASGNPGCGTEAVPLDTGITDPSATFQWYKEDEINPANPPILIPGATDAIYEVQSTGTFGGDGRYIVEITFGNSSCESEDDALVQFVNQPTVADPPTDLVACETDGDNTETFNLTLNTPLVIGAQTGVQAEYFNEMDRLITDPTNYINTSSPEIITVRVSNNDTANGTGTCAVESTFTLTVSDFTSAVDITYALCDNADDGDDTNGFVTFQLDTRDIEILGTQDPTQFSVSYHSNPTDAMNGDNPLPNAYPNTTNTQIIYARVENNDNPDCVAISEVILRVDPLPVLDNPMVQLQQCDEFDTDSTDAISDFNLTQANQFIVNTITDETFTYYTTLLDAESETNPITNALSFSNADAVSNTVYVRVETNQGCARVAELELIVLTGQLPNTFSIAAFEECDDTRVDDNITDGVTVFDFSSAEASILALFPSNQNISVDFYESAEYAASEINPIADISNHVNVASPFVQEIFFRVENDDDNTCEGAGSFFLRTINPTPRTDTETVDIIVCDDVTVGDNVEEFNLTQNEAFIFDGIPNLVATYFTDYNSALNNSSANQILTPTAYNNTNLSETIYVRVVDTLTGCFAIVDFDITVNPLPLITSGINPIEECENSTDGFFTFNLTQKEDEILNGQDPTLFSVTYYTTPQIPGNLDATMQITDPTAFTNTVIDSQEIFYAINNITTANGVLCSNTGSFFVEVINGAEAADFTFEACDENIPDDEITQFNLESIIPDIVVLNGQDPDDFVVAFFEEEQHAIAGTPELPLNYENRFNNQVIYARVSNALDQDRCFDISEVTLQVNPKPSINFEESYILCLTSNEEAVTDVPLILNTGLLVTDYSFIWYLDGVELVGETSSTLNPSLYGGGEYMVEVTDTSTSAVTMCVNTDTTLVIESGIPDTFEVSVTSMAFTGNNMITATVTGNSTYEFSLDEGPFQSNGEFDNVTGGEHIVYVRDVLGCGILSQVVTVIDYPKFFTPNGDGNHDTWNILGIGTQPSAKIYIFDRYGKLLKQLSPNSQGWDGTYQGNRMPTDDYWFVLEYVEPTTGEPKQQRAHFTLKR